jgi:predicted HicB family RNase H-like nuclease
MLTATRMAGRKKEKFDRERIELRAEPEWIERVTAEAERLGLSLSAYIRLAVNERLEKAPPPRPKKGS